MVTKKLIERLIILYLSTVQSVWCCSETVNLSQELISTAITSPNFGTNQLYPFNINCEWTINAPNKSSIFLVFHSFDLEFNQYCGWDYVSIQNGVCGTSGNRYCGANLPPTFEATSGQLCVQFRSDVIISKKGFNATVSISKPVIEDKPSTIPLAPCKSTPYVINSTFFITSPNFQIQQNYPNNAHCQWIIASDQRTVTIEFKAFDVENHPNCGYDSLKLYNGSATSYPLLSTYCGIGIPTPLTVNSTTLILFSSDFIVPKSGFKALITFSDYTNTDTTTIPLILTTEDTKESSTSTTASLKTAQVVPDFHTNLVMTLISSTQTKTISNGASSSPPTTDATANGLTTPNPQTSTTEVSLSTDNQASTLSTLSTNQIPSFPATYEMCSQSAVQVSDEVFIQSPNYGYLQQYPLNVNCTLVFNTATGNIISIDFIEMDVENHYSCKWDKVIVFDGDSVTSPSLDTICGLKKPMLNSTDNSLTIQFISDHMIRRKGFKAAVRALKDTSLLDFTAETLSLEKTSTSSPATSTSSPSTSPSSSTASTSSPATSTSSPSTSPSSSTTSTSSSTTSTSSPTTSTNSPATSSSSPTTSTSSPTTSTSSPTISTSSSTTSTSSSTTSTNSPATSTSSPTTSTTSTSLPTTSTSSPTTSTSSPTKSTSSLTTSTTSPTTTTSSQTTSTSSPTTSISSPTTSTSSPATSTSFPTTSTISTSSPTTSTSLPTTSTSSPTTSTSSPTTSISSPTSLPTSSPTTSTNSPTSSTSSSITSTSSSTTSTSSPTTSTNSPTTSTSSPTTSTSSPTTTTSSPTTSTSSPTTTTSSPTTSTNSISICDQTNVFVNDTTVLQSPNYGQGRQYPVNVDCELFLKTNSNQYFYIAFPDFELEAHPSCSYDYLVVYDGGTASNGTQLSKICGSLHNHTIESATNQLFFRFHSDIVVPKAGFSAVIKVKTSAVTTDPAITSTATSTESVTLSVSSSASTTEILTTPKPHVDILASACAGVPLILTSPASSIESPGYSESSTYPNDMNCQWVVEAPVKKRIVLSFVTFDVEHQELCKWDRLSVYEGTSSSSELLIGSYCGNTKPPNIISKENSLYIKFTTDRIVGKQGFKIDVKFINSTVEIPDCNFDWLPCSANGNCIPKEWFCDGEQDCSKNEDENNCDSCEVGEVSCYDGSCLPQYQRCDDIPQCSDAEDEDNCTSISNDGRLLLMKSSKWFPVCHNHMWSNNTAHVACTSIGRPSYISVGSKQSEEKTYAVASQNPKSPSDTSFSKQHALRSSCPSGQTVTLQCQEKVCGVVSENIPQAFIVGGSESVVGEWPWMVAVMSGTNHICGGTIISDQWILTAGHCISGIQHSPQTTRIIAGATNLKATDIQYRQVSEMILHPQYNFIYSADLGLIRLREPLIFTSTIRPLCLPTRLHNWSPSLTCYIAGWGATNIQEAARDETTDYLHHAKVKVWPQSKCKSAYLNTAIEDFMMCAGYEYGHIDACQGDSGGPLMCKVGGENNWVSVGITSWGEGCGGINKPGVYTRVDYYRQWIQQMTQSTDISIECNFETPDICGYMDQSNSSLMWARRSGGSNDPSRPLTDVTLQSQQGSFMYAFIRHEERGNTATLVSPTLDLTREHCLTFWFNFNFKHNYGDIDAVFTVYGVQSDNTTLPLVQFSKISIGWKHAEVDLTTHTRHILFRLKSVLKYDGGVALDEIKISNTSCIGVTKLTCNFDGGTLCNYQQAEDDSDDWQIKVHLISDARSAAAQQDHYLEVNGTNRFPGTLVKLLSPTLNSTVPKCLSFKYKISPMNSHTLSVCTVSKYDGNTYSNCHYWAMSSSANDSWTLAHAQIPQLVYNPFQIGFQAKRGYLSGIVAVDDITRTDGNCS